MFLLPLPDILYTVLGWFVCDLIEGLGLKFLLFSLLLLLLLLLFLLLLPFDSWVCDCLWRIANSSLTSESRTWTHSIGFRV